MRLCAQSRDPQSAIRNPQWTADLLRFHELLRSLTLRELRVRYKQTLLGAAWAVLVPLSMMLIFTFVFTRAVGPASAASLSAAVGPQAATGATVPYALFAFAGLVPWTFFAAGLTGCVNSLTANRNLITKVYFPREVFPLSCVLSAAVDFAVAGAVLAGLVVYFRWTGQYNAPAGWTVLLVPAVVAVQAALMTGLGMILAMANLFYRDVRAGVGVGLQLWMFVSGVVVPVPQDGSALSAALRANPMVPLIDAYRDCTIYGRPPDPAAFAYAAAVAAAVLAGGWCLFRRASCVFAERI